MTRTKVLVLVNTLVLAGAIAVSYLSNTGVFDDKTIGEVSDKYQSLFVPAGFTFSIWGLIYTSLVAFILYHMVKAYREESKHEANADFRKIGLWFLLTNLASAFWVVSWINEYLITSIVLMLVQLISLTIINIRLGIYNRKSSSISKVFTQFPLSIYFAWISIATIANISSALAGLGWQGGGISPVNWTIILISASAMLALFMILARRNLFFGLVVIWALWGISRKENPFQLIETVCLLSIGILLLASIVQLVRNKRAVI